MHIQSHTWEKMCRNEIRPAMKKKMTRMTAVKKKVHQGVWLPLHAGDNHDMRWSQLFTLTPLRLNRPCSSANSSNPLATCMIVDKPCSPVQRTTLISIGHFHSCVFCSCSKSALICAHPQILQLLPFDLTVYAFVYRDYLSPAGHHTHRQCCDSNWIHYQLTRRNKSKRVC